MIYILILIILLGWILIYSVITNKKVKTTHFEIRSKKLPNEFDGYHITLCTDIHNEQYLNNEQFYKQVEVTNPDIILISGDFIDSRRTNFDVSLEIARRLVTIAPTYYVTGNHEYRLITFPIFEESLKEIGVRILRNEAIKLHRGSSSITLLGMDDPHFFSENNGHQNEAKVLNKLLDELKTKDDYTVLLIHRPEFFEDYYQHKIDLALCGHTHGGQIRIPFVGGLIAPHQGFFPKYDAGYFCKGDTQMLISKGLGSSSFPLRVNDQPELLEIRLKSESTESDKSF
ncbi:metallophosphoesterase [Anaerorhabdus furcosa]|uniref:Calcineurin-like phosphoesterase domain-containing protein n=1 Tax=Anaerorhabdus furcosa TaxID=118967 RepID=A0A1T4PFS0_9FIRM|nr:metallophosphoesterase [Anaerorhabdus furcosa]SJZ90167.1 hypothetical protein SAMN02745191_1987 [Anaerorhabdus furcosa]